MSTEQRDIRPFASVGALDHLLRHAVLKVGADRIESGGRKVLEEDVFLRTGVALSLAKDSATIDAAVLAAKADLADLDLTYADLGFAVVMSSGYLRIAEYFHRMPLDELSSHGPELVLSGPPRPAALRTPRSGCQIDVLVHLAVEKPRKPLRPWRHGTWISRASFEIVTEGSFAGFVPLPLTAEQKNSMDLPPKTVRYITLGDSSPLEEGVTEDSLELWLDADLLAKMSANPKSSAANALQRQLFVDAIATIVADARSRPELKSFSWADAKDTLLGRVVELVAPSKANEDARAQACATYLAMIKSAPARFMAYAEESAGVAGAFDEDLGG